MKKTLMTHRLANTYKVFNKKLNFYLCNIFLKRLRIQFKIYFKLMTLLFLLIAQELLKTWHFVADSNLLVCMCIQAISRFGFD